MSKTKVADKQAKYIQFIGFIFFSLLAYWSWIFFKERMINFDTAFYSFKITQYQKYDIELGRWGSLLSQFLPFYAFKHDCSLATYLKLYSLSFILVDYIIFLIITLVLKNTRAGLALMLMLCLGFRHAFYFSAAELYHGMALTMLFYALVLPIKEYSHQWKKGLAAICAAGLIYTCSYFHQLTIFAILFVLLTGLIVHKKYKSKTIWGLLAFSVIWYVIRVKFLTTSTYEQDKLPGLKVFIDEF